jgi:hypothetical protein
MSLCSASLERAVPRSTFETTQCCGCLVARVIVDGKIGHDSFIRLRPKKQCQHMRTIAFEQQD